MGTGRLFADLEDAVSGYRSNTIKELISASYDVHLNGTTTNKCGEIDNFQKIWDIVRSGKLVSPEKLMYKCDVTDITVLQAAFIDKKADLLLENNIVNELNLRVKGVFGQTPVFSAIQNGYIKKIKHLINFQMLSDKDEDGNTPAHIASRDHCLYEIAEFLTVDMLTIRNRTGSTPLGIIKGFGCGLPSWLENLVPEYLRIEYNLYLRSY